MVKVRHERALMGKKPHCPDCERVALRRQGRVGFLQRIVYPRLGLFPWECGLCRKIFMLGQRSTGYRQHATEDEVIPDTAVETTMDMGLEPALESTVESTVGSTVDTHRESNPVAEFGNVSRGSATVRRDLLPGHGLGSKTVKAGLAQGNLAPATLPRANRPNKIAG